MLVFSVYWVFYDQKYDRFQDSLKNIDLPNKSQAREGFKRAISQTSVIKRWRKLLCFPSNLFPKACQIYSVRPFPSALLVDHGDLVNRSGIVNRYPRPSLAPRPPIASVEGMRRSRATADPRRGTGRNV